jgi:SAM-dependent methyltransferase
MNCRACGGQLRLVLDLGETPLANSFASTTAEALALPRYPLRLCVCTSCMFVQLDVVIPPEVLFKTYAYETPRAKSLEEHYLKLCIEIGQVAGTPGRVIEMGSNNGAFLEYLQGASEVLGIEPSQIEASVPTARAFFTLRTCMDFGKCDLFVARHCMAHLDDLRGTLEGIYSVLNDDGWAVIENAYLMDTLQGAQFDQLYHEHHSYFALTPMAKLFESVGLHLRHVLHAPIHGGSIAMFVSKQPGPQSYRLKEMLYDEDTFMRSRIDDFAFRTKTIIAGLREGLRAFAFKTVDTYGATAKGNTLLNVLGPDALHIRYAVDSTPSKIGKYLPGVGVPVVGEDADEFDDAPDAYLLTAWNYADEIMAKQKAFRDAGGRFILPFPYPRLA